MYVMMYFIFKKTVIRKRSKVKINLIKWLWVYVTPRRSYTEAIKYSKPLKFLSVPLPCTIGGLFQQ